MCKKKAATKWLNYLGFKELFYSPPSGMDLYFGYSPWVLPTVIEIMPLRG
jgi:hypothetical protein